MSPINAPPGDLVAEVEALGERLSLVRERIGEVIFGQREVVEQALITLLSGGHALLIGVPGLAKTRLVETLGTILGVDDKRIQCTPDLMPADILGSEVLEESDTGRRSFRFIPGPVFCQLLMATRSTAPARVLSRRCSRRCKKAGCRSLGNIIHCRARFTCWQRRTR
jgi:MoxR-like ATPase